MTEPGAWDHIRHHGLLSTETLLRRAGLTEVEVATRIRRLRPAPEAFDSTPLWRIVLNDNSPLNERKLAACLDDGLAPADWLTMLNQRVFFWVDERRCHGLRDAKTGTGKRRPREVLVFDTASLLAVHASRAEIAPFNTGNTLHKPVRRGRTTFTPLGDVTYAAWRRGRTTIKSTADRIVELVVRDGVPDVADYLIERREVVTA